MSQGSAAFNSGAESESCHFRQSEPKAVSSVFVKLMSIRTEASLTLCLHNSVKSGFWRNACSAVPTAACSVSSNSPTAQHFAFLLTPDVPSSAIQSPSPPSSVAGFAAAAVQAAEALGSSSVTGAPRDALETLLHDVRPPPSFLLTWYTRHIR